MALFDRRHVLGLGVGALSTVTLRPAIASRLAPKPMACRCSAT